MLIIPAVDIKEGKVVRLVKGRYRKKVYSDNPLKTVRFWKGQGARLIHLVDLDAAMEKKTNNLRQIKRIIKAAKKEDILIEVGGGLRNKSVMGDLLDSGAYRVIIGTKAIDENFLSDFSSSLKDKVIISIDEKSGSVFTAGWRVKSKKISPVNLARKLKRMGFKQVIYTDINRDGTLAGPNLRGIKRMLKVGIGLIASGGISSVGDISRLKSLEKNGLAGVIIGKALYEKKFSFKEALRIGA